METELKPGRQPGSMLAEEALKFRVPPDLMVTEERWVMVEVGVKGQQRQERRVFRFWLAWTHLEFYPFKSWAWPEQIKDPSVAFTTMACLATVHLPAH